MSCQIKDTRCPVKSKLEINNDPCFSSRAPPKYGVVALRRQKSVFVLSPKFIFNQALRIFICYIRPPYPCCTTVILLKVFSLLQDETFVCDVPMLPKITLRKAALIQGRGRETEPRAAGGRVGGVSSPRGRVPEGFPEAEVHLGGRRGWTRAGQQSWASEHASPIGPRPEGQRTLLGRKSALGRRACVGAAVVCVRDTFAQIAPSQDREGLSRAPPLNHPSLWPPRVGSGTCLLFSSDGVLTTS